MTIDGQRSGLDSGLDSVTDSERRPLRPIGASVHDVATRTGRLLGGLAGMPGVRVFEGVRPVGFELPAIPHAVSSGSDLLLVDSVAWPPGSYALDADGGVRCDGVYIGQSIHPLLATVRRLRRVARSRRRIAAVVIVHPCASGPLTLPERTPAEVTLLHAGEAVRRIRLQLRRGRPATRPARRLDTDLMST